MSRLTPPKDAADPGNEAAALGNAGGHEVNAAALAAVRDDDTRPFVSVVVPHYNDLPSLARCLEALQRQTYPRSLYEIIVADNASPEGEAAVAQVTSNRAQLVTVTQRGAGAARNGGVAVAKGDVLAFTDSDCRPEPGWLEEGVQALAHADFIGGRMVVLVDDAARMSPTEAFESVFAFDNEGYVRRKKFTVTANLLCPRTVFDRVGGFEAGVSEDIDWSHRAVRLGYRISYAARAVVGHPARRTWPELTQKWRRTNAESYLLAAANGGGTVRWFLRSLALPISAIAHTPKVLASARLTNTDQRLAALRVLYRLRWWRFINSLRLVASRGSD